MVANISNIQQVYNSIPSRFIFEDITYDNYQLLTELHFQHGWRNVIIPEINQGQKLENDYVLIENIVTKLVIDLTPEEIAEANKPIVPESISRMNLKIQLLLRNIEIQEIEDTINSIPDFMFPEVAKKISIIKFNEAVTFDRYNADLNLIATLMGLSQEDLDQIFINGNI